MKKFKTLMCIAVAAMAFTGCSKDDAENLETPMVTMIINAGEKEGMIDESRTFIDNGQIYWSAEGEDLAVLEIMGAEAPSYKTTSSCTLAEGNKKAMFAVSFPAKTGTAFTYYSIHPAAAYVTGSNGDLEALKLNLPQTQYPSLTSFDGAADLMVSKKFESSTQPTSLDLSFGRVIALGNMSIKNLKISNGEFVKSVTFKADGKTVTGRGKVNLAAGQVLNDQWGYGISTYNFDNVILSYKDNTVVTPAFAAWFACAPFEIAATGKFSVEIVSNKGTYLREVTVAEGKSLAFKTNSISTFSVDMANAAYTPVVIDMSLFDVSFGATTTNTTYSASYNMAATGTIADAITYNFSATSNQIRGNSNGFVTSDYVGASGSAFWWAPDSSLTIGNITLPSKLNYELSFGGKITQSSTTTIQASISKDGTNFFPLSESGVVLKVKEDGDMLKVMNFHLEGGVTEKISIRLTVTGLNSVIDDVKLLPLDVMGASSFLVDFATPPSLTTTPDNGGSLSFVANNGTAGIAPEAKLITYTWAGSNCTFEATKDAADTWYTITNDNSGTITVAPQANSSTTADRTGTITLSVKKNGTVVKSATITVSQMMQGAVAQDKIVIFDLSVAGTAVSATKDGITYTFAKASGGTAPTYNAASKELRMYAKNTLLISGATIKKVDFDYTPSANGLTPDVGTWVSPSWTGEAASVLFTAGGTSGHVKIRKLTVTYTN